LFVGYGADVTPRIFYENFIELMVTIDASNECRYRCMCLISLASS